MISDAVFTEEMKRLSSAFNKTIGEKVLNGWFKEIEEKDERVFKATISVLMKADHYPNLGQFWARYHEQESRFKKTGDDDSRGCADCKGGYLHFIQRNRKTGLSYEVIAFCKICYPEKGTALDARGKTFEWQKGFEPFNHQGNATIPRNIIPAMLNDLHDKMSDPSTDWDEETKKAWKQSKDAENSHRINNPNWE